MQHFPRRLKRHAKLFTNIGDFDFFRFYRNGGLMRHNHGAFNLGKRDNPRIGSPKKLIRVLTCTARRKFATTISKWRKRSNRGRQVQS